MKASRELFPGVFFCLCIIVLGHFYEDLRIRSNSTRRCNPETGGKFAHAGVYENEGRTEASGVTSLDTSILVLSYFDARAIVQARLLAVELHRLRIRTNISILMLPLLRHCNSNQAIQYVSQMLAPGPNDRRT
jgi:hypothetical protein